MFKFCCLLRKKKCFDVFLRLYIDLFFDEIVKVFCINWYVVMIIVLKFLLICFVVGVGEFWDIVLFYYDVVVIL